MCSATKSLLALYLVLLLAAVVLLFFHLGDRLLWGDEAETALLAVSVTKYGIPLADDGINRITLMNGGDLNDQGVWVWSPWLDEYLAAGSFLLFGKTTVAARLPFALFGLASIILLALLAYRLHGTHASAVTAAVLLTTCVPFLLHARQCRYYAVLVFTQICLLWGLRQLLAAHSARGAVQIGLALASQFYCNYIVLPGNVLALIVTGLLLRRRVPWLLTGVIAALATLTILALPWLIYAPPGSQLQAFDRSPFGIVLAHYLLEIHFHIVPWVLLLFPFGVAFICWCRYQPMAEVVSRFDKILWCFALSHLMTLAVCPLVFFRYLMPLIPVLLLLATSVIERFLSAVPLRVGALAILTLSNCLAYATGFPVRGPHRLAWTLPTFVRSITSDYTDRCEDVVSWFSQEAKAGQSVYVADPSFPLIFYADLQVIDARFHPAMRELPDWFLPVGPCAVLKQPALRLPRERRDKYRPLTLTVHASSPGCRRPNPHAHRSFTPTKMEHMTIYRKRSDSLNLMRGETLPVPDATVTDADSDLEDPKDLLLTAASRVAHIPQDAVP